MGGLVDAEGMKEAIAATTVAVVAGGGRGAEYKEVLGKRTVGGSRKNWMGNARAEGELRQGQVRHGNMVSNTKTRPCGEGHKC